jgi:hypothetical protein
MGKREVDLVVGRHEFMHKLRIGCCDAMWRLKPGTLSNFLCCTVCNRRKTRMMEAVHERGVQRVENLLDVKTLIDSGINLKILLRRVLSR